MRLLTFLVLLAVSLVVVAAHGRSGNDGGGALEPLKRFTHRARLVDDAHAHVMPIHDDDLHAHSHASLTEAESHVSVGWGGGVADAYPYAPGYPERSQRSFRLPLTGGGHNCVTEVTNLAADVRVQQGTQTPGMIGVAIVLRANGGAEMIWAESGQDSQDGLTPALQRSLNQRARGYVLRRAMFSTTAKQRNKYMSQQTPNRVIPFGNDQTFTYRMSNNPNQPLGAFDKGFPSRGPAVTERGNVLGVCAGAKISYALSSKYNGSLAVQRGDRVVCMAEINYTAGAVTILNAAGNAGPVNTFQQGTITPSCASCQKQIYDMLY